MKREISTSDPLNADPLYLDDETNVIVAAYKGAITYYV